MGNGNKKRNNVVKKVNYPIIENDGSIINSFKFGEWGKKKHEVILKLSLNGKIEELETNLLHITQDSANFNILKIVQINTKSNRKTEYIIKRKDIFLIENFKPEFSEISMENSSFNYLDYNIEHIDGDNSNDALSNLIITNNWNEKIVNPPFKKSTPTSKEIYDNKNKYFVFDLQIDNDKDVYLNFNTSKFKILPEYPDLKIYPSGVIINKTGKTEVKNDCKGYNIISYQGKKLLCHQLLAKAFLKNQKKYSIVNHLDGNKSNNKITNLEWVNNSFNMLHWLSGLNIPFTSQNYRNFILSRILLEKDMDVEFWIFSNMDPFKLLYCVLHKKNIFNKINEEIQDKEYSKIMKFLNNKTFNQFTKNEREIKIVKLLERHQFPLSKKDHIIELLKEIGVDFIDYFNWLFDELKYLAKDEVGFIYFEEFLRYYNLINKSKDGVYINSILETNKKQNN
jgi:hypothetical protein